MSDSVRPYRWQPTSLPLPWGSPGKNTGVGLDHHDKMYITIKQVTWFFWFPSTYKSYVYIILYSIKCAIALCLKIICMSIKNISLLKIQTIPWSFSKSYNFCWWSILLWHWWLLMDQSGGWWRLGWLRKLLKIRQQWSLLHQLDWIFLLFEHWADTVKLVDLISIIMCLREQEWEHTQLLLSWPS